MQPYPANTQPTIDSMASWIAFVSRARSSDINEFNNISSTFIAGRKVGKIPSGSTDISSDDRVGDFNYDPGYIYICIENGGSAAWRRVALSAW